jgi:predicted ATPase
VVARVQQLDERALVQRLSRELDKQHRLVTAQALDRVGQERLSFYRFRHYLFQHYLYYNLDDLERAYLHEAVGLALEALHGKQTEPVAVQLARHFEQAGLWEKALSYLLQAGNGARRLSANEEAIGHLSRGLELLKALPDTPERFHQELEFQIGLGNALAATKGYTAPEVGQTFSQARALYQHADVGESPQLFPVLHALHRFYMGRGELQTARELGEQVLSLAQRWQDHLFLGPAQELMGATLMFMGEFALAQVHLEQALALFDPQQHLTYVSLYGLDGGVFSLAHTCRLLWLLGYPDQAVQRSCEAILLAQELAHPFSLSYALICAAWVHLLRREAQAAQEQAEAAMALSTEYGFALWWALSAMHRGWALTEQFPAPPGSVEGQGQGEEGIVQIRQGMAALRETGAELLCIIIWACWPRPIPKWGRSQRGWLL